MTLPSDTYFKKGVNIQVFIGHMQKIFILTDLMFSGQHLQFENFIRSANIEDIEFTYEPEYWNLHNYDCDSYDELFCVIDHREGYEDSPEFVEQLHKRMELLKQNGFKFILARPWESAENVANSKFYALLKGIDYTEWFGGTTWFWYWMRDKHRDNKLKVSHDHNGSYWHKTHDFLYLNKAPREHRIKLYNKLKDAGVLDNSIHTFTMLDPPVRLEKKYELPGIDPKDYPRWGKDQDIYELPYVDTVCSIVSETNDNDHDVFMTEKIWKPIMAQHVFIVHGNYLYLQKLREMGFKTFGSYFDESYDLEQDPNKRIDKLVSLCKDLKSKCDDGSVVERGNKEWHDIYQQTQALRKHNYDVFWNDELYERAVQKTVLEFLGI
jgi:hypothetical protein